VLRTNILQILIDRNSYDSYLEIGLGNGKNFENIVINNKVSVDPDTEYNAIYQGTSDNFFKDNNDKFDIVFNINDNTNSEIIFKEIIQFKNVIQKNLPLLFFLALTSVGLFNSFNATPFIR